MKHVIWQMGACIYGLMALEQHNLNIDRLVDRYEDRETELRNQGYSVLGGYSSRVYSKSLCKLVEECLLVDPKLRPSPRELRDKTYAHWKPHFEKFKNTGYKNPVPMQFPKNLKLDLP